MTGYTSVLIADADPSIRSIVKLSALEEGWDCDEAPDGISALKMLKNKSYHLIILDTDLPEVNGKIISKYIHHNSRIPILFLGSSAAEEDRLAAFNSGGNDYVLKPFFPRELMARIRNLLEIFGTASSTSHSIHCGHITMDTSSYDVQIENRKIKFTPREYELLLFLCRHPHQVFSREMLLDQVWGPGFSGSDRTVDTHVKSLRIKIRPYHNDIQTVWGIGYKFEP